MKRKEEDNVNEPLHYTQGSIEVLDYIIAKDFNFLEGNIIKYISRYKFKNGIEDLKKAQFYLNKLIDEEEELKYYAGFAYKDNYTTEE